MITTIPIIHPRTPQNRLLDTVLSESNNFLSHSFILFKSFGYIWYTLLLALLYIIIELKKNILR